MLLTSVPGDLLLEIAACLDRCDVLNLILTVRFTCLLF